MIRYLYRGLLATVLACAVLAPASPAQADESTLLDAITSLPVAEEILDGYKRELYPRWKDNDKNGCSARNDVLIAEAIEGPTIGFGCTITGGVWHSYYGWTTERGRRYANELGSDVTLVGVSARSDRQKADQAPATWMPMPAVQCRYIGEWVATKHRWALAVDPAEREALLRYAADCPNTRITYTPAD
ncbi:HNH endonuclease [Streptomyces sp. NPDC006662]|uniref:HNH endonuclease n=1 Tax=Streptomyces sp. NPDC006662 TaxID=3156902 RepID=UPI00340F2E49